MILVQSDKALKLINIDTYETIVDFSQMSYDKIVKAAVINEHELITINSHNFAEKWNYNDLTLN